MKTQAEKTVRALEVYLELLDAAEYMRRWMRPPLDAFDLTMERFRLLVYLCRDGAMPMTMAAKKLQLRRGNVNRVVEPLEERGFVQRQTRRYAAAERKASKLSKAEREEERGGREFVLVRLTTRGRQFLECVLPRHAKVVKALMRALDGREQETLGELCRRLRAGDALKFASEMTHAEEWQDIGVEE